MTKGKDSGCKTKNKVSSPEVSDLKIIPQEKARPRTDITVAEIDTVPPKNNFYLLS